LLASDAGDGQVTAGFRTPVLARGKTGKGLGVSLIPRRPTG